MAGFQKLTAQQVFQRTEVIAQQQIQIIGHGGPYSEQEVNRIEQLKQYSKDQNISMAEAIDQLKQHKAQQAQAAGQGVPEQQGPAIHNPDYQQANSVMEAGLSLLVQRTVQDIEAIDRVVQNDLVEPAAVALANIVGSAQERIGNRAAQIIAERMTDERTPAAEVMLKVLTNFRVPDRAVVSAPQLPATFQRAIGASKSDS